MKNINEYQNDIRAYIDDRVKHLTATFDVEDVLFEFMRKTENLVEVEIDENYDINETTALDFATDVAVKHFESKFGFNAYDEAGNHRSFSAIGELVDRFDINEVFCALRQSMYAKTVIWALNEVESTLSLRFAENY